MDTAIVFTYGRPSAGREKLAFEAFQDAMTFFEKKAVDGLCAHPIPFVFMDGGGLFIVNGERARLMELTELDEFRHMYLKAGFAIPDLKFRIAAMGESAVGQMGLWAGVGAELGYF